ncbi:MAG: GNAT family N-acetyltransferase [Spirochaetia bacterium]
MSEIICRALDTIDAIDRDAWNSIVSGNDILNTHEYQRAIERSGVNDFRYRYLLFHRQGKLVAHVSVGIFTFGIDVMLQDPLKSILARIKQVFPSFLRITLIECGHPTALGTTFVLENEEDMPEVLALLDAEMGRMARAEKTSLCAIRDISADDQRAFQPLLHAGYRVTPNMANTFLRLPQASFETYLADLVAKRRHEIRQRIRVFQEQGCTIEKISDYGRYADDLVALWQQTFRHAKEYQREVLTREYFTGIAESLADRSFVLMCRKGDRPIGFTLLLDSGNTLISTYCGLDYEMNRSTFTYFVLFYRSIEEAIRMGKEWLELGITNYNPKLEVGALPEPLSIYVKALGPVTQLFFAPLLRLMSTPPSFNKRHIFNERYYERHRITEEIIVRAGGGRYATQDVSEQGLSLLGGRPLRKRTYTIELTAPQDFTLAFTARVRSVEALPEGRFRMGLSILRMPPENEPHWQDLLRRFSAGV